MAQYQLEIAPAVLEAIQHDGELIDEISRLSIRLREAPLDVGEQDGPSPLYRIVAVANGRSLSFTIALPIRAVRMVHLPFNEEPKPSDEPRL